MKTRIGIAGSGYIGRGLLFALGGSEEFDVTAVLTRTDPSTRPDFPRPDLMTRSLEQFLEMSDLVVECSGDVVHATQVVDAALEAGCPVVTIDAEMHVTTGSYFVGKGYLTEAEGDQPGCLAALAEDAVAMGFQPLVYGNIKGFLNHKPTPEEMEYWGAKQGITMPRVVSFTDGTKLQIEQTLTANGLGATIAVDGLLGPQVDVLQEAIEQLVAGAAGRPIADYVLSSALPPGVFIIATHGQYACQRQYLRNYKLGDGPYYLLLRPYHLCHLEVPKTLRRVMAGGPPLLNNSPCPEVSVAAVAKRDLRPGHSIACGIGSFDVRGIAVKFAGQPSHCPVGLLHDATIVRSVEEGQLLTMEDVELPDSLAVRAWTTIVERVAACQGHTA
ncbi:MAG TPA: NAD(P)-dependent oxidoreductase [Dehalococcoidia bacterium]|nr:NAD(P)-dependent oxidoreductase [Dehalococcoidia bacterium]